MTCRSITDALTGRVALLRVSRRLLLAAALVFCVLLLLYRLPAGVLLTIIPNSLTGCPTIPVISCDSRGRLGNNLGEYATIYAFGIRYGLTPVATPNLLRLMRRSFPHTRMREIPEYCTSLHERIAADAFEALPLERKQGRSWFLVEYPHHVRLFWRYRDVLREEMAFRAELVTSAQQKLRDVARDRENLTFVGVHVRRTDYARHIQVQFGGGYAELGFYTAAMYVYRRRYNRTVFVVTSDDPAWCREHLSGGDVHVLADAQASAAEDLALLAACNHSVYDYGTFGFFGAFLAGGDLVTADGNSEAEHELVTEFRLGNINVTFVSGDGRLLDKCRLCT